MQTQPPQGIRAQTDAHPATIGTAHQVDPDFLTPDRHPVDAAFRQSGPDCRHRPGRSLDVPVNRNPYPFHAGQGSACALPPLSVFHRMRTGDEVAERASRPSGDVGNRAGDPILAALPDAIVKAGKDFGERRGHTGVDKPGGEFRCADRIGAPADR